MVLGTNVRTRVIAGLAGLVLGVSAANADMTSPTPKQGAGDQKSNEALQRDKIRRTIEANIEHLKGCVAGTARCVVNDVPQMLLGLTRPEVEAILGPPHYQLHLAANNLYYWTVSFKASQPQGAIRLQVSFGDCYFREKNSRRKAVCDAALH